MLKNDFGNSMVKRNFSGAMRYYLLEGEARLLLESGQSNDRLLEKRIEFREQILNELVYRVGHAHCKIQLMMRELDKYYHNKLTWQDGTVSLEAEILEDAIAQNLLEISELVKQFGKLFRTKIRNNFAFLFMLTSKNNLKIIHDYDEAQTLQYRLARSWLFPSLEYNQEKIPESSYMDLAKRLEEKADKLIAFRDKVIAHKFDEKRFKTVLTYQEYLDVYEDKISFLGAISIVATLRANDWSFLEHFNKSSRRARDWLHNGLTDSVWTRLKRMVSIQ